MARLTVDGDAIEGLPEAMGRGRGKRRVRIIKRNPFPSDTGSYDFGQARDIRCIGVDGRVEARFGTAGRDYRSGRVAGEENRKYSQVINK